MRKLSQFYISPLMAYSSALQSLLLPLPHTSRYSALTGSKFLSSTSLCNLNSKLILPKLRCRGAGVRGNRGHGAAPVVVALQSNFFRVVQTVLRVGKDGIDAGTNLVPDSVPRPIARVSVTVAAVFVSLFVLRSFVSTALFALGTMGFIYFIYLALNKDKGSKRDVDPKSTDEALDEARRIMDKYK